MNTHASVYPNIPKPRPEWDVKHAAPLPWQHAVVADNIAQRATRTEDRPNWDIYMAWLVSVRDVCPVCHNRTLVQGKMVAVESTPDRFGNRGVEQYRKESADRCPTCGYIEFGLDPESEPFWFYVWCWEHQINPRPDDGLDGLDGEIQ